MKLEKRKGKWDEGKFTSAVLTFFFPPSNRIWIIPCFISIGWFREHLPILIQANAECEMAASNRNDPLDKRVHSGLSSLISHSPSCLCRLRLSELWQKRMCKREKDGLLSRSPPEYLDTHIFIEAAITMTIWGNWAHVLLPCQMQYESLWTEARGCQSLKICPCPCICYIDNWATVYQNTHFTSTVGTFVWHGSILAGPHNLKRLVLRLCLELGLGESVGSLLGVGQGVISPQRYQNEDVCMCVGRMAHLMANTRGQQESSWPLHEPEPAVPVWKGGRHSSSASSPVLKSLIYRLQKDSSCLQTGLLL